MQRGQVRHEIALERLDLRVAATVLRDDHGQSVLAGFQDHLANALGVGVEQVGVWLEVQELVGLRAGYRLGLQVQPRVIVDADEVHAPDHVRAVLFGHAVQVAVQVALDGRLQEREVVDPVGVLHHCHIRGIVRILGRHRCQVADDADARRLAVAVRVDLVVGVYGVIHLRVRFHHVEGDLDREVGLQRHAWRIGPIDTG